MLKRDEIQDPNSCLNKAADDEPIFVLRAQDLYAPQAVRGWANNLAWLNGNPTKVAEARALAAKMEAWPNRKKPD